MPAWRKLFRERKPIKLPLLLGDAVSNEMAAVFARYNIRPVAAWVGHNRYYGEITHYVYGRLLTSGQAVVSYGGRPSSLGVVGYSTYHHWPNGANYAPPGFHDRIREAIERDQQQG